MSGHLAHSSTGFRRGSPGYLAQPHLNLLAWISECSSTHWLAVNDEADTYNVFGIQEPH